MFRYRIIQLQLFVLEPFYNFIVLIDSELQLCLLVVADVIDKYFVQKRKKERSNFHILAKILTASGMQLIHKTLDISNPPFVLIKGPTTYNQLLYGFSQIFDKQKIKRMDSIFQVLD